MSDQPPCKLFDLPLGSRFRYLDSGAERRTYVLLGLGECGLVGDAPANKVGRVFQGLYSAAESRKEFEDLLVEFVPVCEAGPALLEVLLDLLKGTRLDQVGNRNDDGLMDHGAPPGFEKRIAAALKVVAQATRGPV